LLHIESNATTPYQIAASLAGLPLMYATQTLSGIIASTTKLFEVME